jgi:hypothetical protein
MSPERARDVRAARRREGGAARDGALVRRGVDKAVLRIRTVKEFETFLSS